MSYPNRVAPSCTLPQHLNNRRSLRGAAGPCRTVAPPGGAAGAAASLLKLITRTVNSEGSNWWEGGTLALHGRLRIG
ncbi:hypothetical protein [Hydrogenophaga sp. PBC]|uniref:hypothetical protein n=1 Tax=Hydrogenophaga sp. PBC TaxID=795665 RepID=UPI0002FEE015|nr:hypothetical protein [Hydrogenophaga sp. PBC]